MVINRRGIKSQRNSEDPDTSEGDHALGGAGQFHRHNAEEGERETNKKKWNPIAATLLLVFTIPIASISLFTLTWFLRRKFSQESHAKRINGPQVGPFCNMEVK